MPRNGYLKSLWAGCVIYPGPGQGSRCAPGCSNVKTINPAEGCTVRYMGGYFYSCCPAGHTLNPNGNNGKRETIGNVSNGNANNGKVVRNMNNGNNGNNNCYQGNCNADNNGENGE